MRLQFEADAAIVPAAHERRRHHRNDLCFKVRFEVLGESDTLRFLEELQQELTAMDRRGGEWYMQNVSSGGLGLCGSTDLLRGRVLREGDFLKLEIKPPRTEATVRCVGEVAWVELLPETGLFRAGVSFVGVNPEDLERLGPEAGGQTAPDQ